MSMMSHINPSEKRLSPDTEISLNCAAVGNKFTIISMNLQSCGRASTVRLMELGLVPGVEVELVSTSYGLVRIRLRGAEFSMRAESAAAIQVKPCS